MAKRVVVSGRALGLAALSVATLGWGVMPLLIRAPRMPGLAIGVYWLALGAVIYGMALGIRRTRPSPGVLKYALVGGLLLGVDVALSFSAYRLTSVMSASVIQASVLVVITLGAARWFGERAGRRGFLLALFSMVGVAVASVGASHDRSWTLAGDLLAFAGVFTWSAFWLYSKRAREEVAALQYITWAQVVGAAVLVVLCVASRTSLEPPRGTDWIPIVALGIIGTGGHSIVAWAHRVVDARTGALIVECYVVVSVVAAWIVLHEHLTVLVAIGGTAVFVAALVSALGASPGEVPGSTVPPSPLT